MIHLLSISISKGKTITMTHRLDGVTDSERLVVFLESHSKQGVDTGLELRSSGPPVQNLSMIPNDYALPRDSQGSSESKCLALN